MTRFLAIVVSFIFKRDPHGRGADAAQGAFFSATTATISRPCVSVNLNPSSPNAASTSSTPRITTFSRTKPLTATTHS